MMVAPVIAAAGIGAVSDLVGGLADQYFSQKASDQAWKRQKKVLQNQIQWRTADAIAAGLHPLAALGLSPAAGPSAVVDSIGDDISRMGANIGRAAEAYLTPEDKLAARLQIATVERAEAERDLVRSQVAGSQKALLTQGATPGIASALPAGKADKLGSGGFIGRDADGNAFNVMPGWTSQDYENDQGEIASEAQGLWRMLRGAQSHEMYLEPNLSRYSGQGDWSYRRRPYYRTGGGGW